MNDLMYSFEFATELWESVDRSLSVSQYSLVLLDLDTEHDQCSSLSVGCFPDSSTSVGDVVFL